VVGLQMTMPTLRVLRALLADVAGGHYGLELCKVTGLASGTVYPILNRLEKAGWLDSSWEDADPAKEGRPRRRLYKLSRSGAEEARYALAAAHQTLQYPLPAGGSAPQPEGGGA